MKYIRTKNGIVGICTHEDNKNVRIKYHDNLGNHCPLFSKEYVLKQADTIEELCDAFVRVCQHNTKNEWHFVLDSKDSQFLIGNKHIDYGAIWTDKGLIYVAKMNDKGELELL